MKTDLSDKTVLVYDHGLTVSWAERLFRDFDRVLYYVPWKVGFPTSNPLLIGHGVSGIDRITNLWEHVGEADLIVFPDVLDGDLQVYLRSLGKRVWGAGMGEELELDRWFCKELLKQVGLPVQPCERIIGLKALREYLQENDEKAIKISRTRGDGETWIHENYELSETKLDAMEAQLGAKKYIQEFIVEDLVEADLEVGFDGYCIDGEFPALTMFGYEIKDRCLIDAVIEYEHLPAEVREVNKRLAEVLRHYNYRGFFSTEIRIGKDDGLPYLIDLTCRAPIPSGEIQQECITNWGEIMWHGANGEMVEPQIEAEFGSEAIMHSDLAAKSWMPIYFPDELSRWVKLFNHAVINENHYAIPQDSEMEEIGSVVGIGSSVEEANEACREYAEQVKGYKLEIHTDALDKAVEEIEKGKEQGVLFG